MPCDHIQLELHAYLRGELDPEEHAAVERHLSTCAACSEEATAMKELGDKLSRGLKHWVDQGVCPPEVMGRIEFSIRAARKKPWWQRWPVYAGAVAAVFIFLIGSRMDWSQQVASIPLVGSLAAQLWSMDSNGSDDWTVTANATDDHDGIRFTVQEFNVTRDGTRVRYSIRGADLDTQGDTSRFRAQLSSDGSPVELRTVKVHAAAGEVTAEARFAPVKPGSHLTVSVHDLPVRSAATLKGTWKVSIDQ